MNELTRCFNEQTKKLHDSMLQMRPARIEENDQIFEGVYLRTVHIPKGTVVVGATHSTAHFSIVSSGHIIIADFQGVNEYRGFSIITSPRGTKRVVQALEDTIFSTIHITDKLTADEVIADITDTTADKLINGAENLQRKLFESNRKANYAQIKQQHQKHSALSFQQLCLDFD